MLRALFPAAVLAAAATVLALSAPGSAAGPLVCIDPGHGGGDTGAVNGSLREADINLDVAFTLAERLADDSIDSTFTRTDDSTKSSRDRYSHCNDAGADLYVGVHTNSVTDPTVDGALSIYFHRDDQVFARDLQDAMLTALGPTAPDPGSFIDFGLKKDALGVILKTDMPGAVAEPVFMSNAAEAARLAQTVAQCSDPTNNQCRRAQIAEALYNGITNYLSAQSAPTDTPPGDPTATPTPDSGGPPSCPPGQHRKGVC